jgi:hypothetical protein
LWWTKLHWRRFSLSTSVSPANHSTNFSIIIITRGWHNRPIGGRSAEWTQLDSTPHYTNWSETKRFTDALCSKGATVIWMNEWILRMWRFYRLYCRNTMTFSSHYTNNWCIYLYNITISCYIWDTENVMMLRNNPWWYSLMTVYMNDVNLSGIKWRSIFFTVRNGDFMQKYWRCLCLLLLIYFILRLMRTPLCLCKCLVFFPPFHI